MRVESSFIICFLMVLVSLPLIGFCQGKQNAPSPILIDRKILSGLDIPRLQLKKEPEKVLFQKRLYRGDDLSVYIISTPTTTNKIKSFSIEEFVLLLNGRANVAMSAGNELVFERGDMIALPKGFDADWTNSAGAFYHLELSVLATNRSKALVTPNWPEPVLIQPDALSGLDMSAGDSKHVTSILKGTEIDIEICTEEPQSYTIVANKDKFLHILHGTLTLTMDDVSMTYYAGDNLVIPKGFSGLWKSNGNGAFRYIFVASVI